MKPRGALRFGKRRRRRREGALGDTVIAFEDVSIVFGDNPGAALPLMDAGRSREEIMAETGQILGVHDASLEVRAGEIVVLMGLSGSGKSTLLRAVNGLAPVCRGRVRVAHDGAMLDVTHADGGELRRLRQKGVSMVFQQFGLLPWRTVAQNVGLGPELAGVPRSERAGRVAEQLELVGLTDRADARVGELSGGMQQRVGLARAFATEAPLLLMDEPFSALDPLIRSRLQDELQDLQRELRRTILFVSHDLDEAFKLGDRIAIMEGGRIVQVGTPHEIIAAPSGDYVAEFVGHMNPLLVLTARDAMGPAEGPAAGEIDADAPIRAVIEAEIAAGGALDVTEDGAVIGQVTGRRLLAELARRGGGQRAQG